MNFPVELNVKIIDGKVTVIFSQSVTFLSMDIQQTEHTIRLLQEQLDQLKRKTLS